MTGAPRELGERVVARARALGFALAGIAPAEASDYRQELLAWLGRGAHGSMDWLARLVEERLDPRRWLSGARSIILVADLYHAPGSSPPAVSTSRMGRVARYARGDDYHRVMKDRLHTLCDELRASFPAESFRAFADTAPILEREHAARAGLGWVGKHTLLIHPRLGSWFVLGGIATTLTLEAPDDQTSISDHCGTCTRCIDACPTRAITPHAVDASRCISYLTIEHRGPIDAQFHEPIGDWLFGCDVCQEVCPHNRDRAEPEGAPHPAYAPRREGFDLLEVLGWTEDDRRAALTRSAMKRAKLDMWKRNAIIAAGNLLAREKDGPLLARMIEIARSAEEPEMVRAAARDVLEKLGVSLAGSVASDPA